MSITKKWLAFCLAVCMIMPLVAGCGEIATKKEDGKLHIVTTVFPYYDFAKQIGGDRVSVDLIVPAGMDTHSFEPTAKDMVTIGEADVFIYNGGTMESWVPKVLEAAEGKNITTLRMMDHVKVVDEEIVEGMQEEEHEHHHDDKDHHEEDKDHHHDEDKEHHHDDKDSHDKEHHHDDKEHHHHDGEEGPEMDEHVWTSPANAIQIVKALTETISGLDKDNAQTYQKNAEAYIAKLEKLDKDFHDVIDHAKRKEIIVGDRFPFLYFAKEFGLTYYAAFPGCSTDTEANPATIAFLVDKVKEDHIPVVFHIEMSNEQMSKAIAEATGAKNELLNAVHNVSDEEFKKGVTYIDLMNHNVKVLKEALN